MNAAISSKRSMASKCLGDLEYCFKLLLKRIRIAVVDLAFSSITLSNGTVGIRPRVVFANDKSKVLVSRGNYKQLNDSSVQ